MNVWVALLIGIMIGGFLGVGLMCILNMARENSAYDRIRLLEASLLTVIEDNRKLKANIIKEGN